MTLNDLLSKSFYEKILNAQEISELERYNESPALQSALHKVLLAQIYYRGNLKKGENPDPSINFALFLGQQGMIKHEELGRDLQCRVYALQLLEESLQMLTKFKKESKNTKEDKNPAR